MKKLLMKITRPLTCEKLSEVLSLERLFHSIEISLMGLCDDKLLEELSVKHGARVKMLYLNSVTIKNVESFREILNNFKLLEHLEIYRMQFQCQNIERPSADQKVDLKELKFIRIEKSSTFVIDQINRSSMDLVQLWSVEREGSHDFMAVSKRSTKLEVNVAKIRRIFHPLLTRRALPFKLKSFYVTGRLYEHVHFDADVSETFIKFLKTQTDSIIEIDVTGIRLYEPDSIGIFEVIFNEFPHLSSLKFDLFGFNHMRKSDANLFNRLKPNMGLRHLDCGKRSVPKALANKLLIKCPGIETLYIYCEGGDLLPFLAFNNSKLKSLTLKEVCNPASANLKFKFLENFVVFISRKRTPWLSFVMNNTSIRRLVIINPNKKFSYKTFNTLKTHPNLNLFNNKELVFEEPKMWTREKKMNSWFSYDL